MTAQEFNEKYLMGRTPTTGGHLPMVPHIVCRDGYRVSCQAGASLYCIPRESCGPWTHVELGFPSEADDLIMEWAEDPDFPTETVYGYVPLDVVMDLFAKHGGIES